MTQLAISIVLYRPDLDLLAEAIESLDNACSYARRAGQLTFVLDLVNNDPLHRQNPDVLRLAASARAISVSVVEADHNGGYGAGNNISIRRHADAEFHIVMNPDVVVERHAIANAIEYLDANPDVGLLTPQVAAFDGTPQYLCKENPTLLDMFVRSVPSRLLRRVFRRRNLRYEMHNRDYGRVIRPVPYPTGCFMFFRRAVLERTGGFDEGYFLHYEDADMGRLVSRISETAYVPNVLVRHKWSRDSHKSWRMRWITIKSGLRYWRKWGGLF